MRVQLVKWHKWIGLCGAVFLLFQALSGALLSFRSSVESSFAGIVTDVEVVNVDLVVERLQSSAKNVSISRIKLPTEDEPYIVARLKNTTSGAYEFVAVNASGQGPIYRLDIPHGVMYALFQLHENLKLGTAGRFFNTLLGSVLLFMAVTGVYFWWPLRARQKLKISWNAPLKRRWYDLHRVVGILLVPVLVVLVFTGAGMSIRLLMLEAGSVVGGAEPAGDWTPLNPVLANISQSRKVVEIRFNHRHQKASVSLETPDAAWSGARDKISVDLLTGEKSEVARTVDSAWQQKILGWLYPLHSQLALGTLGQFLILLSGLFLSTTILSGIRLWWLRKFSKNA